jgi:hypothetical protein
VCCLLSCSRPNTHQHAWVGLFVTDLTGFWGKYLNTYGTEAAGRGLAVPAGWSEWGGLVGNSRYYNYNMSRNGQLEQHHADYGLDYFTDLISRDANAWITKVTRTSSAAVEAETAQEAAESRGAGGAGSGQQPFLAVLSTPACHDGTVPAPQYDDPKLLNGPKLAGKEVPRDNFIVQNPAIAKIDSGSSSFGSETRCNLLRSIEGTQRAPRTVSSTRKTVS